MSAKTILLIYKSPNMQEVIHACLTDLGGWNVLSVSSTSEGLQQAKLENPDAIVWEDSFNKLDEIFLQQLRTQPETQNIPVLLLNVRTKWFNSNIIERYQLKILDINLVHPIKLTVQIANFLGWKMNPHIDLSDFLGY